MISLDGFVDKEKALVDIKLGNIKPVAKVSTDTRVIVEGVLFVALSGENFDGNAYLEEAISKGAKGCLFTATDENTKAVKELYERYPEVFFIGTKCTETYFQKLASFHLSEWRSNNSKKVIGITGSNGKTTTKELMAYILEKVYAGKILFTQGNLNNHLGVPMTLLRLDESFDICILEMGTNHPGEIAFLCNIGDPDSGIITSIGQSHLEFFENEENVFKEKRSLYDYVHNKSGFFSVDSDNVYLKTIAEEKNLLKVSFEDGSIIYDDQKLTFKKYDRVIECKNLIGSHNFKNLAVVISLLLKIFPDKEVEIFESSKTVRLPDNNRSQFIKNDNQTIFLDAYNANPSSMMAALETFKNYLSKNKLALTDSLFVLGDMNELGDRSSHYHQELGKVLKDMEAKNVIFVGRFSGDYAKGFDGNSNIYESTSELLKAWPETSKGFTSVFLKGSRTLQLEQLMTVLST